MFAIDTLTSQYNISGLDLVREDMGLNEGDLLLLDGMTEDQNATINEEHNDKLFDLCVKFNLNGKQSVDTFFRRISKWARIGYDEIQRTYVVASVFAQMIKDQAEKETKAWMSQRREALVSPDYARILSGLVDHQEDMAVLMNSIQGQDKARKDALKDLDSWVKRYNSWVTSPAYKDYPHKKAAAKIFFEGLKSRKSAYQSLKTVVQAKWDNWKGMKEESDKLIGQNTFLWAWYFDLAESDVNPYFTNGDTEDVDSFELMIHTPRIHGTVSYNKFCGYNKAGDLLFTDHAREVSAVDYSDLMDSLEFASVVEDSEYDRPEANGIGFWSFREEYKANARSQQQSDDEYYLASVMEDAA